MTTEGTITPRRRRPALYSVDVPGMLAKEGEGCPRVNPLTIDEVTREVKLTDVRKQPINTLYLSFRDTVRKRPKKPFLGTRIPVKDENGKSKAGPYMWLTYEQVLTKVSLVSRAFAKWEGMGPQKAFGLYGKNCAEWVIAEHAAFARNWITVPLYDTLGKEAMLNILNQTEMHALAASEECALKLIELLENQNKQNKGGEPQVTIEWLTVFSSIPNALFSDRDEFSVSEGLVERALAAGIKHVVPFSHLLLTNAETVSFIEGEDVPPASEDLCTICYTSGATGMPKGAMIPHYALLSACLSIFDFNQVPDPRDPKTDWSALNDMRTCFEITSHTVYLSYLPLAHIFERLGLHGLEICGGSVGFYQGDITQLTDDAAALQPTVFFTVPRLLNRIHDKVLAGVAQSSSLSRWIYNTAYSYKLANLKSGAGFEHWLWDWLVFGKIKEKLGGRLKCILSGSAPLSQDVLEFTRIAFFCEVYEGYGQTEACGGDVCTAFGDWSLTGHVGAPAPSLMIKLVDIPEMGYRSTDKPHPRGEICFKGATCFIGYYRDEAKTKETIDEDGWVHSGDIGSWDALGRLRIIDRKKNIFKLAQGEYVAPERVENILIKCPIVQQAFVYGDPLENSTVALIVPDEEILRTWATKHHIINTDEQKSLEALLKDVRVRAHLTTQILSLGKEGSGELTGIETPRGVILEPTPMSLENGLLTSTFKARRPDVAARYLEAFRTLYSKLKNVTGEIKSASAAGGEKAILLATADELGVEIPTTSTTAA